jgi:hypothetical protein
MEASELSAKATLKETQDFNRRSSFENCLHYFLHSMITIITRYVIILIWEEIML